MDLGLAGRVERSRSARAAADAEEDDPYGLKGEAGGLEEAAEPPDAK